MIINILITTGADVPKVTVKAHSNDTASLFIDAETMDQANELLKEGQLMAYRSMEAWSPTLIRTEEDADPVPEDIPEKYIKRLQTAETFTKKRDKLYGLTGKDVFFLSRIAESSIFKSICHTYDLGFKRGYDKAKKAYKQKNS